MKEGIHGETILLSEEDWCKLVEILSNPPEAGENLKKAAAEYKKEQKEKCYQQ